MPVRLTGASAASVMLAVPVIGAVAVMLSVAPVVAAGVAAELGAVGAGMGTQALSNRIRLRLNHNGQA